MTNRPGQDHDGGLPDRQGGSVGPPPASTRREQERARLTPQEEVALASTMTQAQWDAYVDGNRA